MSGVWWGLQFDLAALTAREAPRLERFPKVNLKQMILEASKHGAPLDPKPGQSQAEADENLCLWVDAYFPRKGGGKWNRWSVIREAYRVRAEQKPLSSQRRIA